MAINETIVTGRKYRQCVDASEDKKIWQRKSFWSKADDCVFDDGTTLQNKCGSIKGITTNMNVSTEGYAADMRAFNLNKTTLENKISALNTKITNMEKTYLPTGGSTMNTGDMIKAIYDNLDSLYKITGMSLLLNQGGNGAYRYTFTKDAPYAFVIACTSNGLGHECGTSVSATFKGAGTGTYLVNNEYKGNNQFDFISRLSVYLMKNVKAGDTVDITVEGQDLMGYAYVIG